MWLVENWGVDKFREAVAARMGDTLAKVRKCGMLCVSDSPIGAVAWRQLLPYAVNVSETAAAVAVIHPGNALWSAHQQADGAVAVAQDVHVTYDTPWERRDVLGIHPQQQVHSLSACCSCVGQRTVL